MSWKTAAPIAALALSLIMLAAPFAHGQSGVAMWSQLFPTTIGPPAVGRSACYDPLRHRMLSYGYQDGDVWELPLTGKGEWRKIPYVSARFYDSVGAIAAYDEHGDRMLVYLPQSGEVWALALSGTSYWSALFPEGTKPTSRTATTAVYDSEHERLLVFAGLLSTTAGDYQTNDLWACYTGAQPRWEQITVHDPFLGPQRRQGHSTVYDPVEDRLVVFGGYWDGVSLADTWEYSFQDPIGWHRITTAAAPEPEARYGHTATYDPGHRRMIVFGGHLNAGQISTWALNLDGASDWQPVAAGGAPGERFDHTAVFDVGSDRMVVSGGMGPEPIRETWALPADGSNWLRLKPEQARLPRRASAKILYDTNRQRMLMFGGVVEVGNAMDIWVVPHDESQSAIRIPVSGEQPPPSIRTAYDSQRDRILALEDDRSYGLIEHVWSLALSDPEPHWERIVPEGAAPRSSTGGSMVYDPGLDALVVWGGQVRWYDELRSMSPRRGLQNVYYAALLPLSGSPAWQVIQPTGASVSTTGAIYDVTRHRLLAQDGARTHWWQVPLVGDAVWTILPVPSVTTPSFGTMFHDPVRDAMVGITPDFSAAWLMPLGDSSPGWTALSLDGTPPPARSSYGAQFDPSRSLLFVFGGVDASQTLLDDAWALSLDTVTPVRLSLVSTEVNESGVTLMWHGPAGTGFEASVERRGEDGGWALLATVFADDEGLLRFDDRSALPGQRYGYRLAYSENGVQRVTAESWVDIPLAPRFTLDGIRPNPAPGEVQVAFSLARTGDAEIVLFDLQGRVAARRELRAIAGGAHVVGLPETRTLAAAVYVVRLTQGGEVRTSRVVLAR